MVRHHLVLEKMARRVSDVQVLGLLKLLLKASGK
jgi:RNA-directed DNA polymerase